MHTSRRLGRMLLMLVAVGALGAVSASSAMATVHWSDTAHGAKVSGTLTVSAAGQTTKTCTASSSQESLISSNFAIVATSGSEFTHLSFTCTGGGTFNAEWNMVAESTTAVRVNRPNQYQTAPWGVGTTYFQGAAPVGDFVNGSGSTPSTLTFGGSSDYIGNYGTPLVYISGTLNVTTSTGGLLTLLP